MNASQYLLFHGGQKSTLMTFDTTKAGSAATHLILPFVSTGTYACTIFWGDGTSIYVNAYNDARLDHTYAASGTYDVEIVGQCWGWRYNNAGDKLKITAIKRWGTQFRLGEFSGDFFYGCTNLTIPATDTLDTTGMIGASNMFPFCSSLTKIPSFRTLDTSAFDTLAAMFYGCTNLDEDFSGWDIRNVESATNMFYSSNALSTANYDALLISWAAQTVQPNVAFHAGDATYTSGGAAEAAHDVLTGAPNLWTITDGGGI